MIILNYLKLSISYSRQFTVSTVETSSTDCRLASRAVTTHSDQRYTDLTPIRYGEITTGKRGSDPKKKNNKIDPVWGSKKPLGPTPKDLELLSAPNPTVSVNFRMKGPIGGTGSGRGYTGGNMGSALGSGGRSGAGIGGLESSVDPRTLMPKFSMDI